MKRLTALTIAVLMILSIFSLTVSADETEERMTKQEYYAAQSYLIAKYKDGDISYSEFQQQTQAVTDEYITNNTIGGELQAGALNASNTFNAVAQKIGNTVQKYGDAAREYIDDYVSDFFNSYTVLSYEPTTGLEGHGALCKQYINGSLSYAVYCDYIEVLPNGNYNMVNVRVQKRYNGSSEPWRVEYTDYDGVYQTLQINYCKVYGDVRYPTGEQAPTDDEFETISDYDFSQATDRELEDLLKKILNEMQIKEPDLSTLEGLLNAIYSRLGTLDSDNDNAMLSAINAAIISLATDTNNNNAELIESLKELKEAKTEGADLDPILKELKEVNKSLDYLKTINTLDLIGDSLESLLSLTDTEQKFLDTYATLILNLTSKFGYAPVTAMISNIEAIMLNGQPPQDIEVTIYSTQVILLSTSSLEGLQISETLNLAKLFVSVLLVISWLYAMRKKITGGA